MHGGPISRQCGVTRQYAEEMNTKVKSTSGSLESPTAKDQTMGATVESQGAKSDLIGESPTVIVLLNYCLVPFVLHTGSQFTMVGQRLFRRCKGGARADTVCTLCALCAANAHSFNPLKLIG